MPIVGTPVADCDTTCNAIKYSVKRHVRHVGKQEGLEKGMIVVVDITWGTDLRSVVGKQGWPLWRVLDDDGIVGV